MAHYAFINGDNVVTEVIVGNDETTGDWETYYANVRGQRCLRTSYNAKIRGNYAAIGYTYRDDLGAFVPPCPGDGWTLDTATYSWREAT